MRVAVYGRPIHLDDFEASFRKFTEVMAKHEIQFELVESFAQFVSKYYPFQVDSCHPGDMKEEGFDFLMSLGGDGTVLDTLSLVHDSGLPVLGVNLGRFGFLANITLDELDGAVQQLKDKKYSLEGRSVIEVEADVPEVQDFPFALNDFVVQKRDSSSMITVDTYQNDQFMNSYWSDGLILATPTGSSGYSLSCGGPLIFPGAKAFALTPIAVHNLTVRPVILPDDQEVLFEVKSRSKSVLVSIDSRSFKVPVNTKFKLRKARFLFNMVRLEDHTYMDTIRTKLMWGVDSRNKS
jgi:NAD+ kinase